MTANQEKIKSGVPFVRFYGNDWYTGCAGLKADERGVYISVCVYIWTTGKRVPLDDAEAARMMGFHFSNYQRIRDRLVVKKKVQQHENGYGVERAEKELDLARDRSAPSHAPRDGRRVEPSFEAGKPHGKTTPDSPGSETGKGPETNCAVLTDLIVDYVVDPIVDPIVEVEKSEEILRANKEPITNNQESTPKAPQSEADILHRQAFEAGQALKSGKVAKSARAGLRTKGELDGSNGIAFQDGKLTVVNGSAAAIARDFPGVDIGAVCNRAGPEVSRMRYPTHDDAMACLRKWAQIVSDDAKKASQASGRRSVHPSEIPHKISPSTVLYAKPANDGRF